MGLWNHRLEIDKMLIQCFGPTIKGIGWTPYISTKNFTNFPDRGILCTLLQPVKTNQVIPHLSLIFEPERIQDSYTEAA